MGQTQVKTVRRGYYLIPSDEAFLLPHPHQDIEGTRVMSSIVMEFVWVRAGIMMYPSIVDICRSRLDADFGHDIRICDLGEET